VFEDYISAKNKDIFNKNIEFFKSTLPVFYEIFHNFTSQNLFFIQEQDEELNIIYQNFKLYQNNPKEVCKKQVQEFINNPYKIRLYHPTADFTDLSCLTYKYMDQIYDISPLKDNTDVEKYNFEKECIPLVSVIGVGLGYHIEYLIQNLNIKHLIILETESPMFYSSLYSIEWKKIYNHFKEKNGTLNIFLKENAHYIDLNPIFVFHSLVYMHFNNEKSINNGLEKIFSFIKGIGYYEDEKTGLKNTILNIKNKIPLYFPAISKKTNAPVFIIGGGPSLDNSIETIKKYKDKALIFSCGTALRTLEKTNIKPDFHFEIERDFITYEVLDSISKEYLKDLLLIANNTIYSDIHSFFKKSFMFLKPKDAGSQLFSKNIPRVYYCNPTVVNATLAMALNLGFKNIYLFGTDMGFKNPEYHHSKDNITMDKENKFFQTMDKIIELQGTFEDKIYTSSFLFYSKNILEGLLSIYPDVYVYNCSDGVKIKNTIPLRIENLNLQDITFFDTNKNEIIEYIENQFSDDYLQNMTNNQINVLLEQFYNILMELIDIAINLLNQKIITRIEIIDIFSDLHKYVKDIYLINGSVLYFQALIYSHSFVMKDESISVQFINDSFSIFKTFLYELKKDLKSLLFGF